MSATFRVGGDPRRVGGAGGRLQNTADILFFESEKKVGGASDLSRGGDFSPRPRLRTTLNEMESLLNKRAMMPQTGHKSVFSVTEKGLLENPCYKRDF